MLILLSFRPKAFIYYDQGCQKIPGQEEGAEPAAVDGQNVDITELPAWNVYSSST